MRVRGAEGTRVTGDGRDGPAPGSRRARAARAPGTRGARHLPNTIIVFVSISALSSLALTRSLVT